MRWRKALLAVVVFLVTLELVLQVGALAAATLLPRAGGGGAVLCVGDSFTFGVGATSPATSYPGRLPAALAARGLAGVTVHNAGFPGQHSGDVLRRLPGQLSAATRVLCVLVGTNDAWRHPSRVDLAELRGAAGFNTSRFEWCWRTARLVQLAARFDAGAWRRRGDADAEAAATVAGPTAEDAAIGWAELARWGLAIDGGRTGRYEPDRTLPSSSNDEFWRLMGAGDFARACSRAEQSVREHPESPLALQQVVAAAARTGQRDEALAAVDRLAQLARSTPSPAATECLAQAYLTSGQPDLAMATARQRIAEQPLSIMAWDSLQQAAFVLGRRDDALRAMPETMRLLGRSNPSRSAFIARNFARWFLESDPEKAVGLLVGAHFVDANCDETRASLIVAMPLVERRRFEAALTAMGPEREAARVLGTMLDEVYAGKGADEWAAVLREHLAGMHEIARSRGVQLVVLGYPFAQPMVEQAQREAARSLGVPFVAIRERFDRELRTRAREDLFVPDGHCSDAGYALIADLVSQAVAPFLGR
ncbi:MAG TPA: GDSL-type esterase/lipase family protein [Planctomycetota bacterium]|nr:GDSL-type esterase/lipase family protein [Planctomycetota bacterium]